MRRNGFIEFGRRNLKGWLISLFISAIFAFVILLVITPKEKDIVKPPLASRAGELRYTLHLIAPMQLGVEYWQIGDYAKYQYSQGLSQQQPLSTLSAPDTEDGPNFSTKTLTFHIIDELSTADSRQYWLKITGMFSFRNIPVDIYQLGNPVDMRITPENRRYKFLQNYFPSKVEYLNQSAFPTAQLVKLGYDEIETKAGRFKCIRYQVDLGPKLPPQEIWVNPKVRPLGIVRAKSQDEIMELTAFGQETAITIPKLIQPVIQGISILDHGCNSCHGYDNCHESIYPPK